MPCLKMTSQFRRNSEKQVVRLMKEEIGAAAAKVCMEAKLGHRVSVSQVLAERSWTSEDARIYRIKERNFLATVLRLWNDPRSADVWAVSPAEKLALKTARSGEPTADIRVLVIAIVQAMLNEGDIFSLV